MIPSAPELPLVAILRGLAPTEALAVADVLYQAGFRTLEVPLNRPGALECIALLAASAPADTLIGGGTMLSVADVEAVYEAGGRLLVSPNCNPAVIRRAVGLGMYCAPGVATPTEAFAALDAGAHALKLFPADMLGHAGLRAFKSVIPASVPLWPVGGITPDNMAGWVGAGASGFGIGGQLYTPGASLDALALRAAAYVAAWRRTQATTQLTQ
ncbi:2-dehydro-3-deoxy-6-phosphogalactonate aldolase [Rugamonas sp. CCM 8940]|uniref:2-dehydro-3-deoxy-6-phosphogalactonate aldolase n=1 Tax=Rugamonas sp. CCM 8940 TaxID=2765359 RepID=UPI0018F5CB99|nr:2-dehydro-3-deoxy-6-phosphogalactonate aldolase [Rugamonas sp. CCM 8940]MBJ7313678.1 2-dehydro-3-deoxy-6-phosphogalactonate aldolase [Rugamonas sp. CCM 8940]